MRRHRASVRLRPPTNNTQRHAEEKNMNIKDRLLQVQAAVVLDKVKGNGDLGKAVGDAAEEAVRDGINSPKGKAYMALFASSAEQLTRLTTNNLDGANTYLPKTRAYIAVNGVCAPGTDAATIKGLMGLGNIDAPKPNGEPLDETVDEATVNLRAVEIPDLPDFPIAPQV
jgi:hypothetical protein